MKRNERIRLFVQEIWAWYAVHKRTLPWRDLPDTDLSERAYKVLVSEIMLQQTQVPRVIVIYRRFLERFPTLRSLAEATNKEVLMEWRGMGYNSRAIRLRDATRAIRDGVGVRVRVGNKKNLSMPNPNPNLNPNPSFPSSMEELTSIPGIGHYTAAAIRNFAFNIPMPCIDTNIRRILHRTFVGPENADGSWEKNDQFLLEIAEEVLQEALKKGDAANWHAALMDFGSLVQIKRNPKWEICPLTSKHIMKATPKIFSIINFQFSIRSRKEPGRTVGSVFIPNRIFRGRVIDALRDAPAGLSLHDIGKQIAIDWNPVEHREWLGGVLQSLARDQLIRERKQRFVLG